MQSGCLINVVPFSRHLFSLSLSLSLSHAHKKASTKNIQKILLFCTVWTFLVTEWIKYIPVPVFTKWSVIRQLHEEFQYSHHCNYQKPRYYLIQAEKKGVDK